MLKEIKKGFTLAEVLIVIGIIGVVAALTLPNLNHATGDKETVTKVKKIYSTLTEAVDRAQVIYGAVDTWGNGLSTQAEKNEQFAKRVTEFLKVSKDCGFEGGCFSSSSYDRFDDDNISPNFLSNLQSRNDYMVMLPDGISLSFECDPNISSYLEIRVDIDGPNKGKNLFGKDIFEFYVPLVEGESYYYFGPKNQLMPLGPSSRWTGDLSNESDPGNYATAWVIENGNLDYLKCYDQLNWETKTSCE